MTRPTTALDIYHSSTACLLKSLTIHYFYRPTGGVAVRIKLPLCQEKSSVWYSRAVHVILMPTGLLSSLPQLAGELYSILAPPSLYSHLQGDTFALRSDYAMGEVILRKNHLKSVSDTHWATWLLMKSKVNKPAVTVMIYMKKISSKMGLLALRRKEMPEKLVEVKKDLGGSLR